MEFRLKLVSGVAAVSLVAGVAACGPAEQAQTGESPQANLAGMDHAATAPVAGEGGEGEGGAAATMTPEQQHMLRLALIRGHLTAGNELISRGRPDLGAGHSKHPRQEIYDDSHAEFEARGQGALGTALDGVVAAVEASAPDADRQAAVDEVFRLLAEYAAGVSLADHAEAISELMTEAASEYAIGVVDGAIATPHEYQDAWGFIRAGAALFEARKADYVAANPTAAAEAEAKFAAALAVFPDVLSETPPDNAAIRAATTQVGLALFPFRDVAPATED